MFTVFLLMLLTTLILAVSTRTTFAQDASTPDIRINHLVTVYDGGMVIISDTITLSKKTGQQPAAFSNFQLGFPNDFRSSIYRVWAYEGQNPKQGLGLDLDTGLGVEGFYGVKVHFNSDVDLNSLASFSFTVVYEFSDLATESISGVFILSFPLYPSLTQESSICSTIVVLPPNANVTSSSHAFNQTTSGTLVLEKSPLAAFTLEKSLVRFEPETTFSVLDVNEVKRTIVLNEWNELLVSDLYSVTNKAATSTSTIWASLPEDAFDISVEDDVGDTLAFSPVTSNNLNKVTITLKYSIPQNQTAFVLISSKLPWKDYVARSDWNEYTLSFNLFEPINVTVNKVTVTVEFPEGASFQPAVGVIQLDMVQNGVFSKAAVFSQSNISSSQDTSFSLKYSQSIFWSSFRPTLWVGALVTIIGTVAFLWQARRTAPTTMTVSTTLQIRPEELKDYVKIYEERSKLQRERESLEAQARKGKIPRRLYRVRSRTLESRLSLHLRDLAALSEKIRSAGPRYSDMMRQIEVANAELQAVEADIERTEARYKRGEISAAAFHKLLEDYLKRKDRAQTNIDGVLLRLREE
jgi:hypothetical protein